MNNLKWTFFTRVVNIIGSLVVNHLSLAFQRFVQLFSIYSLNYVGVIDNIHIIFYKKNALIN